MHNNDSDKLAEDVMNAHAEFEMHLHEKGPFPMIYFRAFFEVSEKVLREKGYICFVDILIRIAKLTTEDYEAWRSRKVLYLERVIKVNLMKLNHMLKTLLQNAKKGGLLASKAAYMSYGKGPRTPPRDCPLPFRK